MSQVRHANQQKHNNAQSQQIPDCIDNPAHTQTQTQSQRTKEPTTATNWAILKLFNKRPDALASFLAGTISNENWEGEGERWRQRYPWMDFSPVCCLLLHQPPCLSP